MNKGDVSRYLTSFQSRWLPLRLFERENANRLANTLFNASRYAREFDIELQFHKGLAGGATGAIQRSRKTSMNPAVFKAAGLILMSVATPGVYPGVKGHSPNQISGKLNRILESMNRSLGIIKKAAHNAGSYVNETDYFQPHWQAVFWGANYPRLLKIKEKVDPNGLFYCHHCVGSEFWKAGGMCRIPFGKNKRN